MSRITKADANKIAIKLAEKKKSLMEKAQAEYVDFVKQSYIKQIPKPVMDFFKKYRAWTNIDDDIRFSGHGFNYEVVYLKEKLPRNNANHCSLILDDKLATEISKLLNRYETEKKEYQDLKLEIENALLALGTYARIEEAFPEAKEYLPAKQILALTVNVADIRKKIA